MSVNTYVIVGVGFILTDEDIDVSKAQAGEDWWEGLETLEAQLKHIPLISVHSAGSYYSGDVRYAIAIKRLTKRFNTYDMPGGFMGTEKPSLTADENAAIHLAAKAFRGNATPWPDVSPFVGILWS